MSRQKLSMFLGGAVLLLFILIGIAKISKPTSTVITTPQTPKPSTPVLESTIVPVQQTKTWRKVLFDIGEWDKNDGETTTKEFQITSDKWRIKWAKRKLTQMSIEVFDSNDKLYNSFTADFNETEGILSYDKKGTYYVRFIGGTSKSAGEWDITVEELR